VGDLEHDTAVERVGEGRYRAVLSRDWEIWGPMGGYIAAVALRAAGAESPFPRPASYFCHYLGVAAFEAVDIEVVARKSGRTALSQYVTITQGERPILDAMVWSVAGDLPALEHDVAEPPDVPGPDGLPGIEELLPDEAEPPFPFWHNLQGRPLDFREEWPPTEPMEPRWQGWHRFVPAAAFDDPWIDSCRALVLVDVQSWPSGHRPHAWKQEAVTAPSMDLYVAFHGTSGGSEWLLTDGYAPIAADGLLGWNGRLWTADRRLWASGGGQLLCRFLG
jgi:acyl-CoA thioesterase